jgi:IS4 transposase
LSMEREETRRLLLDDEQGRTWQIKSFPRRSSSNERVNVSICRERERKKNNNQKKHLLLDYTTCTNIRNNSGNALLYIPFIVERYSRKWERIESLFFVIVTSLCLPTCSSIRSYVHTLRSLVIAATLLLLFQFLF